MKHAKLIAVACACLIGASCGQQEERAFREEYYRVSDSIVAGRTLGTRSRGETHCRGERLRRILCLADAAKPMPQHCQRRLCQHRGRPGARLHAAP